MHEMSYMVKLIDMAEEELASLRSGEAAHEKEDYAKPPARLVVRIGAMTGILPEYLKRYFPEASKGTSFSGAELTVEEVPVEAECVKCKTRYEPSAANNYSCPACSESSGHIIHGRECELARIIWQ